MIVITSGKTYLDIDGYASCLAYREFLKAEGRAAVAVSSARVNSSVPPSLLNLPLEFDNYTPGPADEFIVLDLSNPDFFDPLVDPKNLVEIIDHHPGFEKLWRSLAVKNQVKVTIEPIGAVATLIAEKFINSEINLDENLAKLLSAAILDNTLNFGAAITTARDRAAFETLQKISPLSPETYFRECEQIIFENFREAIINDTKIESHDYTLPNVFAQLTVWSAKEILRPHPDRPDRRAEINSALETFGEKWLVNLISLEDQKSYLLASDSETARDVADLFETSPQENLIFLDRLFLRKEIMRRALAAEN